MKKILFIAFCAVFFTGCFTATAQTKVQPSHAIFLDANATGAGKSVFVDLKNSTKCALNLQNRVSNELRNKGYIITNDAGNADFVLQAQVLFCDHSRENNKVGGAILGAGTALGISSYNHAGGWARVGWSALGALIGGAAAHLSEDDTWDLQVAIRITPKNEQTQDTTIHARAKKMDLSGDEAGRILESEVAGHIADIF